MEPSHAVGKPHTSSLFALSLDTSMATRNSSWPEFSSGKFPGELRAIPFVRKPFQMLVPSLGCPKGNTYLELSAHFDACNRVTNSGLPSQAILHDMPVNLTK